MSAFMLGYSVVVDRTGLNWQDVLSEGEKAQVISATACYLENDAEHGYTLGHHIRDRLMPRT
jgi:hypothetical protein